MPTITQNENATFVAFRIERNSAMRRRLATGLTLGRFYGRCRSHDPIRLQVNRVTMAVVRAASLVSIAFPTRLLRLCGESVDRIGQ